MMIAEPDYVQPNVMITGGFTQVQKIAGMAAAFNVAIANGGAGALEHALARGLRTAASASGTCRSWACAGVSIRTCRTRATASRSAGPAWLRAGCDAVRDITVKAGARAATGGAVRIPAIEDAAPRRA
jgi:hypothetical protein